MLDIGGIGNQKIEYKDHSQIKFSSLDEYITMAKKIISKMSAGFNRTFLNSDDVISYVANAIMMADWRWDSKYKSKEGRNKSQYSYRNQCAIWAIKTLVSKKIYKNNVFSLEENISDSDKRNNLNFLSDKKQENPSMIVEKYDYQIQIKEDVENLLSCGILTEKQKEYISLYYLKGLTLEKIGHKFGITREAVRQNINKSLEKIKSLIPND